MSFQHNATKGEYLQKSLFNLGCHTDTNGIMYCWQDIVKNLLTLFNTQSCWLQCHTLGYLCLHCNPHCLYLIVVIVSSLYHSFIFCSSFCLILIFLSSFHFVISFKNILFICRDLPYFNLFVICSSSHLSHLAHLSHPYFIILSCSDASFEFSLNLLLTVYDLHQNICGKLR